MYRLPRTHSRSDFTGLNADAVGKWISEMHLGWAYVTRGAGVVTECAVPGQESKRLLDV
jgi:hypothetical protein